MGYAARNKTLISFQIDNRHARELEKRGAKWRMSRGQYVRELAIATLEDRQREELDERLRKLEANLREISQRLLATNSNLSRMSKAVLLQLLPSQTDRHQQDAGEQEVEEWVEENIEVR